VIPDNPCTAIITTPVSEKNYSTKIAQPEKFRNTTFLSACFKGYGKKYTIRLGSRFRGNDGKPIGLAPCEWRDEETENFHSPFLCNLVFGFSFQFFDTNQSRNRKIAKMKAGSAAKWSDRKKT
jgi:hypothetical protein